MYSSHHRSSRRRAQGSSRRPQVPRAPPILPDPSLGRLIGVPIHICGNSAGHCVKCRLDQSHGSLLHYPIRGSDGQALYHSQVNVCVARGPRTPGTVPHELHGRIQDFDYTLQLGNHPADPGAWLFDRDRHLAEIGPIENHAAVISKPYGGAMAPALLMRRVNRPGQTYVIEYLVHAAPNTPDQGFWAWYRYFDGSIRVWNWHSTDHSKAPVCVAWKNPSDWHWYLDEIIAKFRHAETEVAAVIIIAGMSVFNNQGRSLTLP